MNSAVRFGDATLGPNKSHKLVNLSKLCPRDKLCLSQRQTGLPLWKIRRKPRFVPRATGPKSFVYVPFS